MFPGAAYLPVENSRETCPKPMAAPVICTVLRRISGNCFSRICTVSSRFSAPPMGRMVPARTRVGFQRDASQRPARFQVGFPAEPSHLSFPPTAPKPPGQSSSATKGLFSRTSGQSKGPLPVPSGWHPAKAAKHLPGWTTYRRPAIFQTPVLSMTAWTNPGHTAVHRGFSKITGTCPLCPADGNLFWIPNFRGSGVVIRRC